jgi:uncharacterized membrane protein YraQ (UPF0718 family)
MVQNGDAENRTADHEETPLLVDQDRDGSQDVDKKEDGEKKNVGWYIWRLFWVLIAAFVLGVFIKGWIDAGSDVNVSIAMSLGTCCADCYPSSIWERPSSER